MSHTAALLALLLLAACGSPPPHAVGTSALVNGGFETEGNGWGTGYIEDSIRKYRQPDEAEVKTLPFVVMPHTDARGEISRAPADVHSGHAAACITNRTPAGPNRFATLVQRITVEPAALYGVRAWVKVADNRSAWFVTTTREWEPHTVLPTGPQWVMAEHRFASGEATSVEVRFVVQAPGRYCLDDVSLVRYER